MQEREAIVALIRTLAPLYNLDADVVVRLCGALSEFRPAAPQGLMRIDERTIVRAYSCVDGWKRNVQAGVIRLRELLDEFAGDYRKALAAYYLRDSRRVHRAIRQHETAWHRGLPYHVRRFVSDCTGEQSC